MIYCKKPYSDTISCNCEFKEELYSSPLQNIHGQNTFNTLSCLLVKNFVLVGCSVHMHVLVIIFMLSDDYDSKSELLTNLCINCINKMYLIYYKFIHSLVSFNQLWFIIQCTLMPS